MSRTVFSALGFLGIIISSLGKRWTKTLSYSHNQSGPTRADGVHDKQLKIYSDLFHEILNEPQRQQVYNDIAQWLRKYL